MMLSGASPATEKCKHRRVGASTAAKVRLATTAGQAEGLPDSSRGSSAATPPDRQRDNPSRPWTGRRIPASLQDAIPPPAYRGSPLRCDPRLLSANPPGYKAPACGTTSPNCVYGTAPGYRRRELCHPFFLSCSLSA